MMPFLRAGGTKAEISAKLGQNDGISDCRWQEAYFRKKSKMKILGLDDQGLKNLNLWVVICIAR